MFWRRKQCLESWTRRAEALDPAFSLSGDSGHSRLLFGASISPSVKWARLHCSRHDLEAFKWLMAYKARSDGSPRCSACNGRVSQPPPTCWLGSRLPGLCVAPLSCIW